MAVIFHTGGRDELSADIQPLLLNQHLLIVDGDHGTLLVDPESVLVLVQEYQRLVSEERGLTRLVEDDMEQPAVLNSSKRIQMILNADLSVEYEQVAQCQWILQLFLGKLVTLCTFDVSADKQPFIWR